MSENNKTAEFLQKLAPCIDRGDMDACVEEAARVAGEMGVGAEELLKLYGQKISENPDIAYVLALTAEHELEGEKKSLAYAGAAFAAQLINKFKKSEYYYIKAIELSPSEAGLHYLFAGTLYQLKNKHEAEKHFKKAIELEPKNAEAHILYGIFLLVENKVEDSSNELTIATELAVNTEDVKLIHMIRGAINVYFSEINYNLKNYPESSKFANIAGDEYLKAAKTAENGSNENLLLIGNVLKAKSFVRKMPKKKSWYKKIFHRFGKNPDNSEIITNLNNAAIYYEKASKCSVRGREDLCNACFYSINVFSEALGAITDKKAVINKIKWSRSLEIANKIYIKNNSNNGVALIDTLRQLIKCVDQLADHRKFELETQGKGLDKCYSNLMDVNEKLEGAFKIISDYAAEAVRDYLKKHGVGFIDEIKPRKTFFDNWLIKGLIGAIFAIIFGIISGIIANRFYGYGWVLDKLNAIESVFRGFLIP